MIFLSFIATLSLVLGAAGVYWEYLSPIFGFYLALAGLALIAINLPVFLVNFIRYGRRGFSLPGFVFGLAAAGALVFLFKLAIENPISDVTNHPGNPPRFLQGSPVFPAAGMSDFVDESLYVGKGYDPENLERQKRAYPDLRPLHLALPPKDAYEAARNLVRQSYPDWRLVRDDPEQFHFEIEAEEPISHMVSDLVIQAIPADAGSWLQIRSRSRNGRSDFGWNVSVVRKLVEQMGGIAPAVAHSPEPAEAPAETPPSENAL